MFVFAVTQLSHTLLEHLTLEGALQTLFLLLAVWWVWMYTCWFTNWIDPDKPSVRMLLFALMLAGLLMSASIPNAFGHEGLLFALRLRVHPGDAYRCSWCARRAGTIPSTTAIFSASPAGSPCPAVFWIAGGIAAGHERVAFWIVALSLEIGGPFVGYFVPGTRPLEHHGLARGRRAHGRTLRVVRHHRAGRIHPRHRHDRRRTARRRRGNLCAFLVAFLGSVAMWWIYFNIGAERGSREIRGLGGPGRVARDVYTYFHIPIVAGIVVCAVADEITIAHPGGHMDLADAIVLLGGPALYLAGQCVLQAREREVLPAVAPGGAAGCWSARAVCIAHDAAGARAPRRPLVLIIVARLGDPIVRARRA